MDSDELHQLREDLHKDIALGLANFKVWLFAGLLTNAFIIGIPAFLAFMNVQKTSNDAYEIATDNRDRLNGRTPFMVDTDNRVDNIEKWAVENFDYIPPDEEPPVPR